jgi:hypothetical protein
MRRSFFWNFRWAGIALLLGVFIAGCGSKVSGKYVGIAGASMTFSGSQVTLADQSGITETCDYTVDGNTITIKSKSGGDLKLTLNSDGSIDAGLLGAFKKS